MKNLTIFVLILIISISNLFSSNYNFDRENYSVTDISNRVESSIAFALDSTLYSFTTKESFDNASFRIKLNIISYVNNKLIVDGNLIYNENKLPIYFELKNEDEEELFNSFEMILINAFYHDLSSIFRENFEYFLKYSDDINSFFNSNNKYREGDLIYLQNNTTKKALAVINQIYDEYAIINYLYNTNNQINSQIIDGPKNQISLSSSYDYKLNTISVSVDYNYMKSIFPFLGNTYMGLSSTYYYDINTETKKNSLDSNLLLELPLSSLFSQKKILRNSSIFSKVKIGIILNSSIDMHSSYELGYKIYLNSSFKIALAYKVDSYNESYNNLLIAFEYML